jgi:hypothetical protein
MSLILELLKFAEVVDDGTGVDADVGLGVIV